MGEASRRKDLVEDVRKKIGDQAADAVAGLEKQLAQSQLQLRAVAFEVEGLRREVAIAKAAPAELRRDVQSFRGDLAMKAENLENLGLQLTELKGTVNSLGENIYTLRFDVKYLRRVVDHDLQLRLELLERWTWRSVWRRLRQRFERSWDD